MDFGCFWGIDWLLFWICGADMSIASSVTSTRRPLELIFWRRKFSLKIDCSRCRLVMCLLVGLILASLMRPVHRTINRGVLSGLYMLVFNLQTEVWEFRVLIMGLDWLCPRQIILFEEHSRKCRFWVVKDCAKTFTCPTLSVLGDLSAFPPFSAVFGNTACSNGKTKHLVLFVSWSYNAAKW